MQFIKCTNNFCKRLRCRQFTQWGPVGPIELDINYLSDPKNKEKLQQNIVNRKGVGNFNLVCDLYSELKNTAVSDHSYKDLVKKFNKEALKLPNKTHPDVFSYGDDPKILRAVGHKKIFDFKEKEFHDICKRLNLVRTEQLGNVAGNKSYYFLGELAELEHSLINMFLDKLLKNNFQLISVPDILPRSVIERCGMITQGDRTQVYNLDMDLHGKDLCLSGTSEIALAGYLMDQTLNVKELPLKLCAVSRCYRAETSSTAEERGIYRVHEFTKVEMFIACQPKDSESLLEEVRKFQEESYEQLGLHYQVLDMPPHELGAQAYRKYDVEAWLPGRKLYGEISSCSNCIDYQARRLNIKYKNECGDVDFVHTLNGTACAVPRLMIALVETGQTSNGTVNIPSVLSKYMNGKKSIERQKKIPELKLIKNKK